MGEPSSIVVTVIIPVYDDGERLKLCLEALENQTFPTDAYEVIAVDNGSTEPIAAVVAGFKHARCLFEGQQGSYAARNLGISQARGAVLAFTDSDCIPSPSWLENGVAAVRRDEAIGLVGGRVELFSLNPQRPTASELYEIMGAFQQKIYVEQKHFGATANLFTAHSVIAKVGPFDAHLLSGGDREWGQRVYAAGYKMTYADDTVIHHPARHSLSELRSKAIRLSDGRYRTRKIEAHNSLLRTFIDILISITPPRRILRIYNHPELHGLWQKLQVTFVTLYMRYYHARLNLNHLWKELHSLRSAKLKSSP